MTRLFETDRWLVLGIEYGPTPNHPEHGFELIETQGGDNVFSVFLYGALAERFKEQIREWQQNRPTQAQVEDTVEQYCQLWRSKVQYH